MRRLFKNAFCIPSHSLCCPGAPSKMASVVLLAMTGLRMGRTNKGKQWRVDQFKSSLFFG